MESTGHPVGGNRLPVSRTSSADALLDLGTKATRLAIMLAVLGMTVWEAFGH